MCVEVRVLHHCRFLRHSVQLQLCTDQSSDRQSQLQEAPLSDKHNDGRRQEVNFGWAKPVVYGEQE